MFLFHAAAAGGGEHFVGAEIAERIEGVAEVFHGGEVAGREHFVHEADFFDADAVFAGDAAAGGEAFVEDFIAGVENAADLLGVAFVEEQNRMNVAIAGVKNIDNANIVSLANFDDFLEDVRQLSARDDAVLGAIARAEAADGAEGLLPTFPELEAFFFVASEAHFASAAAGANIDDLVALLIEAGFETIDFDEQDRLGIEWKAELKGGFDGDQNALIHHFESGGHYPSSDDLADRSRGVFDGFENAEHRAVALRIFRQLHPNFGDDGERAFAADDSADQIETDGVFGRAAEADDAAIGQDRFYAENVIDRHAIFKRVRAARIRRDVATDRACTLARWIRSIVIAGAFQSVG